MVSSTPVKTQKKYWVQIAFKSFHSENKQTNNRNLSVHVGDVYSDELPALITPDSEIEPAPVAVLVLGSRAIRLGLHVELVIWRHDEARSLVLLILRLFHLIDRSLSYTEVFVNKMGGQRATH